MPIRQDDNQPNRRFGIVNIILIGVGALLLFSSLFPNQNTVRFLPKKNNADTETIDLVYNKFKIDHNYANKTR